ncbi:MAG: hypothetical protein WA148_04935, partial [Actinomycetota bacterium]
LPKMKYRSKKSADSFLLKIFTKVKWISDSSLPEYFDYVKAESGLTPAHWFKYVTQYSKI